MAAASVSTTCAHPVTRAIRIAALVAGVLVFSPTARAESPTITQSFAQSAPPAAREPSDDDRKQAEASYDNAVRKFARAQYAEAALQFLVADALAPNSQALLNAMAAARRAQEHLLVAIASDRAITREATDPELAARARQAMAEAMPYLSRIELECEARICELQFDGTAVRPGRVYALPGTHVVTASGENKSHAEERFQSTSGATFRIVLRPENPNEAKAVTAANPKSPIPHARADSEASRRPIPAPVFYGAAALSLALVGVTTWSGVDTLNARSDLSDKPTSKQIGEVEDRIERTNLLLLGTVVMAGLTAYGGMFLVDFGPKSGGKPGGASVTIRTRF